VTGGWVFRRGEHPDHSRPGSALTTEFNLDAQRAQERLRRPQPAGERPEIFWPS